MESFWLRKFVLSLVLIGVILLLLHSVSSAYFGLYGGLLGGLGYGFGGGYGLYGLGLGGIYGLSFI